MDYIHLCVNILTRRGCNGTPTYTIGIDTSYLPPTYYPHAVDIFGHITKEPIFSWKFARI
jgi:hypothetical protein